MIFASDLDGTLIYSKRLIPEGWADLICVEMYQDEPLSHLTTKAWEMLKEISSQLLFIPTTTRTCAQYQRIQFFNEITPKYVIVDNGGIILEKGQADEEWNKSIQQELSSSLPKEEVWLALKKISHPSWVTKVGCGDNELFYYAVINRELLPQREIIQFAEWLKKGKWQLSVQGRKMYIVPQCVEKRNAVAYLQEKEEIKHVFAAGDSLLDLNLLNDADFAIAPAHGELFDSRQIQSINESVKFTRNRGILAGEEIVQLIADALKNY